MHTTSKNPSHLPEPCSEWLDACIARLGGDSVEEGSFADHLDSCPACAAAHGRYRIQAAKLSGLPRLSAPHQLEQSLGFALTPGGRQDRVLAALSALPRREAPDALSHQLVETLAGDFADEDTLQAPAALDGLVAQSLRDLAAEGTTVRVTGSDLQSTRSTQAAPPTGRKLRSITALAAAAILIIATNQWMSAPEASYSFTVVRGNDAGPLQPHQLAMLAAVTGRQCSSLGEGSQ